MMAFFDDLGRRISQAGQGALKKTRNVADTVRINADISDQERNLNNLYNQIGRAYFAIHGSEPDERLKELVESVKETNKRIEELKKQLNSMKDTCACIKCGAMNPENSLFCTVCGARLKAEDEPVQMFCTNCGRMITQGTKFCNYCGYEQTSVSEEMSETTEPIESEEPPMAEETPEMDISESASEPKTETESDTMPGADDTETAKEETAGTFCTACGAKTEPGAVFCTCCGKKLSE